VAHCLLSLVLQTGLIPSANGSAYVEFEAQAPSQRSFVRKAPTIKVSCVVHGPRPLPRNANFSPNLQLTASVKFAPFATQQRRGYIRDPAERDLGVHLENALKGVIVQDRWPKSAIDLSITVLEAEDDSTLGLMGVLAASITAASAALLDARIDCLDMMTGGLAAAIRGHAGKSSYVLDPSPSEHEDIDAACVVAYLPSRDEVVEVWTTGKLHSTRRGGSANFEDIMDQAVGAARAVQTVLKEVVIESATETMVSLPVKGEKGGQVNDVEMKG
jgi:exosome complex component MTR3